jgi:hypothetical protein
LRVEEFVSLGAVRGDTLVASMTIS